MVRKHQSLSVGKLWYFLKISGILFDIEASRKEWAAGKDAVGSLLHEKPTKRDSGNPCGCATKTARRDRSCGKTMLLYFFQPNPWVLRFLDLNSIRKMFEPMNAILKSVSLEPLALAQSKIWNHDKSCLWRCKCLEMPRTRCKQVRSGILNWNESQNHGNGIILLYLGGVVRDWPCEVTPKNRVV